MLPHRPRVADRSADLTLAQRSFNARRVLKCAVERFGFPLPVLDCGFIISHFFVLVNAFFNTFLCFYVLHKNVCFYLCKKHKKVLLDNK